ncbi:MAG TPA: hypothetical protein VNF47_26185 [Streptosporangiaceae bacterium]|nr:hypothetical protein [Streptosporangiaceae bacterium]
MSTPAPGIRRRRVGATGCVILVAAAMAAAACSAPDPSPGDPSAVPAKNKAATGSRPRPVTAKQAADTPAARPVVGVAGHYWVGHRWTTFTEPAHTGPAGTWLAARRLLTQIIFPLAGRPAHPSRPASGPLPMIVFAPGFMQCGGPYYRLLRSWASAGYVVVVVNFPHSDCKVGAAATESDLVHQPADVSYVITRMLALSSARRGLFSGLVNRRQVAIAGQSDGGDTVGAVAANTCCSDHRVVAVAVLSGAEWPPMAGKYFTKRPAPMLFVQGSADTVNWPGCGVQMYRADSARARYYLDLFGANHTGPYWGSNRFERIVARVSLAFFDRYVLKQDSGRAMRRAGNVSGFAALFSAGTGALRPGPCDN